MKSGFKLMKVARIELNLKAKPRGKQLAIKEIKTYINKNILRVV